MVTCTYLRSADDVAVSEILRGPLSCHRSVQARTYETERLSSHDIICIITNTYDVLIQITSILILRSSISITFSLPSPLIRRTNQLRRCTRQPTECGNKRNETYTNLTSISFRHQLKAEISVASLSSSRIQSSM